MKRGYILPDKNTKIRKPEVSGPVKGFLSVRIFLQECAFLEDASHKQGIFPFVYRNLPVR